MELKHAHCRCNNGSSHHSKEEVERDDSSRSRVTKRKPQALPQFRGQRESGKRGQHVALRDNESLQRVRHLPVT